MTTPVDLRYFAGRIEKLSKRLDQVPRMSWATVVTTAPLTIHVDGDPAPLIGEVKNAGPKILLPGTRVQVMRQDLRYTVISASVDVPSRGTSAERVALGLSGVMRDGMRFYDEDEDREYVWRSGAWRRVSQHGSISVATGALSQIGSTGIYATTITISGIPAVLAEGERLVVASDAVGSGWGSVSQVARVLGPNAGPLSASVRFMQAGSNAQQNAVGIVWEVVDA